MLSSYVDKLKEGIQIMPIFPQKALFIFLVGRNFTV